MGISSHFFEDYASLKSYGLIML